MSRKLSVQKWLKERKEYCDWIAAQKTGKDRDFWLEDADYFRAAFHSIRLLLAENNDLRARVAELGAALKELQRYGHPAHPEHWCWCEMAKRGLDHSLGCQAARAALAPEEKP